MVLVSVIVPCYNQGPFLKECLTSVKNQTYKNIECIIVNDGSKDDSALQAQAFVETDNRFHLLSIPNGGVSNARNMGISRSKGQLILPLDGDDKIDETYIEKAVQYLNNHPNINIVYCKAMFFGKKKGLWCLPEYNLENMLGCNCVFCSAVYRKSLYDLTEGYNSNMKSGYEDWDFWLSMIEKGAKFHRLDEVLFYYRIRSRSRQKSINEEQAAACRKQIYENHIELFNSNFLNPLKTFEYLRVKDSWEYKIGEILFRPIRFIYNHL